MNIQSTNTKNFNFLGRKRINQKAELFEFYHSLSTYGSYILVAGFLLIAFYLMRSLFNGKIAGSNPWGALTMEWEIPSPAPPHNFLEEPEFTHGPYAYDKVITSTSKKIQFNFWVLNMQKIERFVSYRRGQIIFQTRLCANIILN